MCALSYTGTKISMNYNIDKMILKIIGSKTEGRDRDYLLQLNIVNSLNIYLHYSNMLFGSLFVPILS